MFRYTNRSEPEETPELKEEETEELDKEVSNRFVVLNRNEF